MQSVEKYFSVCNKRSISVTRLAYRFDAHRLRITKAVLVTFITGITTYCIILIVEHTIKIVQIIYSGIWLEYSISTLDLI